MPSELKPRRPRKGTDDRLERMKGSDPPKTTAEAALDVFRDDLEAPEEVEALIEQMNAAAIETPSGTVDTGTGEILKKHWKPGAGDLITVKGGKQYLPARMRINWLRGGDPDAHPDWGIYTVLKEHIIATRKGSKVEGGYALFEATITDELGRHIATGHKAEYSENFADYLEKAETGAIARALAVAGYGTESAMDLDEGFEGDRLADAPGSGAPIVISGSDVKDVRQGGRQTNITSAQVEAIKKEVARLGISPEQLGHAMETLELAEFDFDKDDVADDVTESVAKLDFEQAGRLIQALMKADPPEGGEDDGDDADEDGDPVGAK